MRRVRNTVTVVFPDGYELTGLRNRMRNGALVDSDERLVEIACSMRAIRDEGSK